MSAVAALTAGELAGRRGAAPYPIEIHDASIGGRPLPRG